MAPRDRALDVWLAGTWSIDRRLTDRLRATEGTFTGTADFTPHGDGLRWWEEGCMRFGDHEGPATRELAIRPAPGGWLVVFDDGRPFHALDLTGAVWPAEHPCAPDHYTGEYRVLHDDRLEVVWDVRGPRKDLLIHTTYRRGG